MSYSTWWPPRSRRGRRGRERPVLSSGMEPPWSTQHTARMCIRRRANTPQRLDVAQDRSVVVGKSLRLAAGGGGDVHPTALWWEIAQAVVVLLALIALAVAVPSWCPSGWAGEEGTCASIGTKGTSTRTWTTREAGQPASASSAT